jgi:hypothetical protein
VILRSRHHPHRNYGYGGSPDWTARGLCSLAEAAEALTAKEAELVEGLRYGLFQNYAGIGQPARVSIDEIRAALGRSRENHW